jgi:hypothetical protein
VARREVPIESQISVGAGGWIRYQSHQLEPSVAFARFSDHDGRLVLTELFVASPDGGLDPEAIRRLPLGRIEAWANDLQHAGMIRSRIDFPAPDLRRAIGYFASSSTPIRPGHEHWVARMFEAQVPDSGEPQAPMRQLTRPLGSAIVVSPDLPSGEVDVPPRRPYPDDFYRKVAAVYSALAAQIRAPAAVMADANHVPLSTVHRWVKETRKRGFLAPGQRGRAG